ncbi:MAG: long-chain fatty acid--CoA ligase, partial [Actinomycetales bacterium]
SHAGILWNTLHQVHDLDIGVDESYLVVPSLSWGAGFHDVTLALTWLGGRNELLPTGTATLERIVDLLEEQQFTRTLLVPTLLRDLLGKPELTRRIAGTALRRIMSGAEPLPASVTDPLAEAMPRAAITQTYGMTEFPMIATVIQPEEAVTHAGKAGRPSSVCQLGVADEDGVVRFEGAGEIVTRSPAGFLGYYNRPEENERAFRDGWFHTGDTGFLDEDGFLTVTGRSKDMIITGGLNVYPREIEEVIQRVPGVAEVAVVGIPDERWGESITAVVVARDDTLTSEIVMERCQQELSKFKCPRRVIISHTTLPKTVTGKILKRQIRLDLAEVAG